MHCHMTHHIMNQMGHNLPNIVGIDPGRLDKRVSTFLPGYMTMGQDGMAEMGDMRMEIPPNSVPMVGSPGPYGTSLWGHAHQRESAPGPRRSEAPMKERISLTAAGMKTLPVPRRSPPRRTNCTATSAACPSPSGPGNRCTIAPRVKENAMNLCSRVKP